MENPVSGCREQVTYYTVHTERVLKEIWPIQQDKLEQGN